MNIRANASTILVSEKNGYVCLGLNMPGIEELQMFDLNFLRNAHNWGVTVVDPDGKTTTKLTKLSKVSLEVEIEFDGNEFILFVYYDDESHTYEIML